VVVCGLVIAGCESGTTEAPPAATSVRSPVVRQVDPAVAQARLDEWRAEVHAFGVSAGIRVPGHDDVLVAAGVDDRDPDSPMQATGVFPIASITKTFVAAVTLQLVDEGRLALGDTMQAWLPGVPEAEHITVGMLLGHTSGLADFANDRPAAMLDLLLTDLQRRFTAPEALAYSTGLGSRFDPGMGFGYSNANYQALDVVVSSVTGIDLADLIATRLAQPIGLERTVLDDGTSVAADAQHGWFTLDYPGDPEAAVAAGTYDFTVPRDLDILDFPRTAVLTFSGGAGGMTSSVGDLLDWGEALYSGRVLGPELTQRMLQFDQRYGPALYGLGAEGFCPCDLGTDPATATLVGHDGSFVGSRTILGYAPDTGVTVTVHANVAEISMSTLSSIAIRLATLAQS
jgi:D-alanyl-D-alanine carboxypeptidase